MRDAKFRLDPLHHRLGRDATRPEYRNFIVVDRHRLSVVGLRQIRDPDQLGLAEVDGRAMDRR
jgi:hypothetical protein